MPLLTRTVASGKSVACSVFHFSMFRDSGILSALSYPTGICCSAQLLCGRELELRQPDFVVARNIESEGTAGKIAPGFLPVVEHFPLAAGLHFGDDAARTYIELDCVAIVFILFVLRLLAIDRFAVDHILGS